MVREMRGVLTCLSMPVKFVHAIELNAIQSSQATAKLETQVPYLRQELLGRNLVGGNSRLQLDRQCSKNIW